VRHLRLQFHPKLYLDRPGARAARHLRVGEPHGPAWTTNVEQFEELTFPVPSAEAAAQFDRYEQIWEHGKPLALLRRSGDWDLYRQRARDRRRLEVEDRRASLSYRHGPASSSARWRRGGPVRLPGYVGITNDEWWELQLRLRDETDRALFWRRNTKGFNALADGGVFFHLVKDRRSLRSSVPSGATRSTPATTRWGPRGRCTRCTADCSA
jgi:hypothetical protein